jgi:hypothetical protein
MYSEPLGENTFIPTFEATAFMASAFGRNMANWTINRFLEIRPVTKTKGFFLRWQSEQAARTPYTDWRQWLWADGAERPRGQDNLEQFEFEPYQCKRFSPGFTIGRQAVQQADWFLQEAQMQVIGQQSMTLRTDMAIAALNGTNWQTNVANVDGAGGAINGNPALLASGQNWTNGTATNPNIKRSLLQVVNIINKLTLASFRPGDLALIISPDTAIQLAVAPEINQVMANSVFAMGNITGGIWFNEKWGLPDKFGGVRILVDETVNILNHKNVAGVPSPLTDYKYAVDLFGAGTAYIVVIPEERNDQNQPIPRVRANEVPFAAGANGEEQNKNNYFPVLSTLVGFFFEELNVEARDLAWDRMIQGSVVQNFDVQVSSWKSGFMLQRILG